MHNIKWKSNINIYTRKKGLKKNLLIFLVSLPTSWFKIECSAILVLSSCFDLIRFFSWNERSSFKYNNSNVLGMTLKFKSLKTSIWFISLMWFYQFNVKCIKHFKVYEIKMMQDGWFGNKLFVVIFMSFFMHTHTPTHPSSININNIICSFVK